MVRIVVLALSIMSVSLSANHWHRHHIGHFTIGYGAHSYWNWPVVYAGYGYTYPQWNRASVGAISYSYDTDKVGFASGAASNIVAESLANISCGASDCRGVVWVQGGCASVATSRESRTVGWAYGDNRSMAIQWALTSCRNHGGRKCEARAWVCSY